MRFIFQKKTALDLRFTALILTGILSVGGIFAIFDRDVAESATLPENTSAIVKQRESNRNRLPNSAANAVLRSASQRTGMQISQLRIVSSKQIMTDGCLNLPRPGEACPEIGIFAWEVTVVGGRQRFVYHSNGSGSQIRLNEKASNISDANLPSQVANAVLKAAAQEWRLPVSALRIVKAERTNWAYGCERPTFPHPCDPIMVSGWRVTVESRQKRSIYNTDEVGGLVRKLTTGNPI